MARTELPRLNPGRDALPCVPDLSPNRPSADRAPDCHTAHAPRLVFLKTTELRSKTEMRTLQPETGHYQSLSHLGQRLVVGRGNGVRQAGGRDAIRRFFTDTRIVVFALSTLLLSVLCTCAAPVLALPTDAPTRTAWRESLRLEGSGDFAQAASLLAFLPRTYAIEFRLGWLHYLATNHVAAIAHYRAAIAVAPQSLEARLAILLPLLAHARFAEAETTARAILHDHPHNHPATLRLAIALRHQGKLSEARRVLLRALPSHPSDPALLNELGHVHAAQNNLPAARDFFTQAYSLDPDNDPAFAQLTNPQLFRDLAESTGPFSRPAPPPRPPSTLRLDLSAYGGYLAYQRTVLKRHATLFGASGFLSHDPAHVFEGGFDHIDIARRFLPRLRQTDATFAYANYFIPGLKLRLGGHYVATEDAPTDGGWSLFGSADYFFSQRILAGAQVAYTRFSDFSPRLEIVQFTPRISATLWRDLDRSLSADLRAHWIHLGEKVPAGRTDFFSLEPRLTLTWERCTLGLFGWAGNQAFALRNDGYMLFNLAERHLAGFGGDLRYAFTPRAALALRYAREEFRELGASNTAAANSFLGTLAVSF